MDINTSKPKFGTDGWRGIIGEDFNSLNCYLVANSLFKLSPNLKKVIIGYDTRKLSKEISTKIGNFYADKGIKVVFPINFDYSENKINTYMFKKIFRESIRVN